MNYKDPLEIKAQKCVNQLREDFVIDILTAERLHDIFVYLLLAQANKNQRGVDMQQAALRNVLRNCMVRNKMPVPNTPGISRVQTV
jgi:hypothetical protein